MTNGGSPDVAPRPGARARRRGVVPGVMIAAGVVMIAGLWLTYRTTREPVRLIKVRWADGADTAQRQALTRQLGMRCAPENAAASRSLSAGATLDEETRRQLSAEARTDVCELLVWTQENLRTIKEAPAIEDTAGFDRDALTIPSDATVGTNYRWLADDYPALRGRPVRRVLFLLGALLVFAGVAAQPVTLRTAASAMGTARPATDTVRAWLTRPFALNRPVAAAVTVVASIPLLVHASGATYIRFLADDYCSAVAVAARGVWGMTREQYLSWSGRYTAHALDGLVTQLGPIASGYVPALALLLLGAGLAMYFARELFAGEKERWLLAVGLALVVLATVFFVTPDPLESLYWGQGMRTVLPAIIIGIALAILLAPVTPRSRSRSTLLSGACALLAFLACGVGETAAAVQTTVLALLALYTWFPRRREPVSALLKEPWLVGVAWTLCGSVIGAALVVASPGNAGRRRFFPPSPDPVRLLQIAAGSTLEFLQRVFVEHFAAIAGVFIAGLFLGLATRQQPTPRMRQLVWLAGSTVVVLFAGVLPAAYGLSAAPPPRTQVIATFIIVLAVMLLGLGLGATWRQRRPPPALLIRALALSSLAWLGANTVTFTREAQTRSAQVMAESKTWDRVDAMIRQARAGGATTVTVPPQRDNWAGLERVGPDPAFWVNECVSQYYGVQVVAASE